MRLRASNQLNMIGTCITVANSDDYKPVWAGNPPADFGNDLATVTADYGETNTKAAQAEAATGGAADVKAMAEAALEDAAYVLARALTNHFKKTGALDLRAKVDLSKSEIVQLRNQDLVVKTTEIRDLGTAAQSDAGAAGRGVTAARVATLTAAIGAFQKAINTPRGQIVNRSTLLKEVETDVASLLEQLRDMDDLVLQFGESDAGKRFVEAWKRARIIVDVGGGHGSSDTPPAPPAPSH